MAYSTDNTGGRIHTWGPPGVMSTGAYLVGARPFIVKARLENGEVYKVDFPFVTRAITVINQDAASDDVLIAFANHANAFDHHAITLGNNRDSITMNVRTPSLYLKASGDVDIELFAEMTNIESGRHEQWLSSDQSRSGVDTDIAQGGTAYPDNTSTNDIIKQ